MTELANPATDTQLDGALLVPADVHTAALRERDSLLGELSELRGEVEHLRARKGTQATQRELRDLREQLEARDRDVRRLKDANLARERLLLEERSRREQLEQARTQLEARQALREASTVETSQRNALLERDLSDARRSAEELRASLAQSASAVELRDRALRELGAERVTLASERDSLERSVRALEDASASAERQLREVRENWHQEKEALRAEHARAVDELLAELEKANGELGRQLAAQRERAERFERESSQLRTQRDRFAKKLSITFEQLQTVRREADEELERLGNEWRQLANLAGEMSWALVVQGAALSAQRNGRTQPDTFDVDEALSLAASSLPDFAAESLWRSRDTLVAQLASDAARSLETSRKPTAELLAAPTANDAPDVELLVDAAQ